MVRMELKSIEAFICEFIREVKESGLTRESPLTRMRSDRLLRPHPTRIKALPDKIGHCFSNRIRSRKLLFAMLDNFHNPCHVFA
jgi:hypothetical protein